MFKEVYFSLKFGWSIHLNDFCVYCDSHQALKNEAKNQQIEMKFLPLRTIHITRTNGGNSCYSVTRSEASHFQRCVYTAETIPSYERKLRKPPYMQI